MGEAMDDYTDSDPMKRLLPLYAFLHHISPLQFLIYVRLTVEHIYKQHNAKIRIVLLALLLAIYLVYVGFAFRLVYIHALVWMTYVLI